MLCSDVKLMALLRNDLIEILPRPKQARPKQARPKQARPKQARPVST
jgi:hypothetical protein